MKNSSITVGNDGTTVVPESTPAVRRKLSPQVAEMVAEKDGLLPVWIRSPKSGPEHYSGFTRSKLYQLATEGHIRSVSIREPGKVKGVRLFHLVSVLDYIARCEIKSKGSA